MFLTAMLLPGLLLVAPIASSEELPAETAAAAAAKTAPAGDKPADTKPADPAATAVAKADADDDFVIPPGFKPRKRGKYTLYCRKEAVMGTRFQAEKCYDEKGIRDYLQAERENRERVDQMRRVCSTQGACGSN